MFGNRKIRTLAPLWAAFAVFTVWAGGAGAQTLPPIAAIEVVQHAELYARIKVAGFTAPVVLRQSGARVRMDLTAGGVVQTYIADREKGVLIAMTAGSSRTALVFPLDRSDGIVPLPLDLSVMTRSAVVKPIGASLVGGRACRTMEFSGYLNQSGMICVDSHNVILQMTKRGRNEPLFEVLDLTMGPQDAQWFRTPPDYQVAVVPGIGGASSPSLGAPASADSH